MAEKSAHILVATVIALIALGITMLLSTSVFVENEAKDIYFDVKRQVVWIGLGFVICAIVAMIDYRFWQRSASVWLGIGCLLLVLCFVPGVGEYRNGAHRWINGRSIGLGSLRLQPSELAKLAVLFVVAGWLTRHVARVSEFGKGFAWPLVVTAIPVSLIAIEVDLGSTALICAMVMLLMYVAGTRLLYLGGSGIAALGALALAVKLVPNRMERVLVFLHPEEHTTDLGMQAWRGMLAFGSGGATGLGLGNGREKLMYLPYAHTDFIFPMVGEELGLVGTLLVVFAFVLIIVSGMLIATHAPDRFGKLLGFGLVCIVVLQAMINIGVTTVLLPNKGLPLPFVSYGGSNLLLCLISIGILLNIYRQGREPAEAAKLAMPRGRMTPRV